MLRTTSYGEQRNQCWKNRAQIPIGQTTPT